MSWETGGVKKIEKNVSSYALPNIATRSTKATNAKTTMSRILAADGGLCSGVVQLSCLSKSGSTGRAGMN